MAFYRQLVYRLVFSLLLLIPIELSAASVFSVVGEIKKVDRQPARNVTVQLMEITMGDRPSIRAVQTTQSDQQGIYQFKIQPTEGSTAKLFYRVSVDIDGFAIGSDPFRLEQRDQPLRINLEIPSVKYGSEHLQFPREILIFESLLEMVRVTTILYATNSTSGLVNAKKIPFTRKIPESAISFQRLGDQKNIEYSLNQGELSIAMVLPEGTQEIFYSYDIPADSSAIVIDYRLIPGMQEIELTTPDPNTEIGLDDSVLETASVTTSQKKSGGRVFRSKIIKIETDMERLQIEVKGIPTDQSAMWAPAVALLVVLLIGLVWYLSRKPKTGT